MKKSTFGSFVLVMVLLTRQLQAQGTIYLSNLAGGVPEAMPVGSDSWIAALFLTGTNNSGYVLDSVQLAMAYDVGNPSGFTVRLYAEGGTGLPGNNLGTLDGSANPNPSTFNTSVIYTYTDDSDIFLSPGTDYYIVLTAGTTMANGYYQWVNAISPSSYNS